VDEFLVGEIKAVGEGGNEPRARDSDAKQSIGADCGRDDERQAQGKNREANDDAHRGDSCGRLPEILSEVDCQSNDANTGEKERVSAAGYGAPGYWPKGADDGERDTGEESIEVAVCGVIDALDKCAPNRSVRIGKRAKQMEEEITPDEDSGENQAEEDGNSDAHGALGHGSQYNEGKEQVEVLLKAERPDVGEGTKLAAIDEEVLGKGEKFPQGWQGGGLAPLGNCEIEDKNRAKCRQNAKEAATVEVPQAGMLAEAVGAQELRSDEVAAEDEEEVDAHPSHFGCGNQERRQGFSVVEATDVVGDYGDDGQSAQGVKAVHSGGGLGQEGGEPQEGVPLILVG